MAKKVKTWLTDDLEAMSGKDVEATQTVPFGIDGVSYEIDLCDKNAVKMRNDIEQWVKSARRTGGRRIGSGMASKVAAPAGGKMTAEQSKAIREWLRKNVDEYKDLGNRGRIPEAGIQLFNERAGV